MKPIKDLAEFLADNPRVNQRALERFNFHLEAIRIQIAGGMDQLNVLTTKLSPEQYSFLSKFVFNLDRTFNALDECAIVPSQPDYKERRIAVENILDKYALTSEYIDKEATLVSLPEQVKPSEFPLTGNDTVDALRYSLGNGLIGSDGSGDCQECKEAFDPKKWLKGASDI